MKLAYLVGARPNFVKMAPVVAELSRRLPTARHLLINTEQHYDWEMSTVFTEHLMMPEPDYLLGVGSGSHAQQTARVMERLEPVLETERPDLLIVPGDVNSTLAASLVAVKVGVPYAHLESGLRSFDRGMPEEINRIVADTFADLLFAHSEEALENLAREGIDERRIHLVGNTMIDSLLASETRFRELGIARNLGLEPGKYVLVTLHRPALVDGPLLGAVMDELNLLASRHPVVFPVHPRTRRQLEDNTPHFEIDTPHAGVKLLEPLGYLEFLSLQADAGAVLTDSGGVQEEAAFLGVRCFTLRETTERPVTLRLGTNILLGLDPARIRDVSVRRPRRRRIPWWDGRASERVADIVERFLATRDGRPD